MTNPTDSPAVPRRSSLRSAPLISVLLLAPLSALAESTPAGHPPIGRLTAYDAAFNALVPADTQIEQIASGFTWSEGPTWVRGGGHLLFTDVPENTLYRWSESNGMSTLL
jgi:gluconolactonase